MTTKSAETGEGAEAAVCSCCGVREGDERQDGVAVDPASGLCLHCQPCPTCGVMGTGCTDRLCLTPAPSVSAVSS